MPAAAVMALHGQETLRHFVFNEVDVCRLITVDGTKKAVWPQLLQRRKPSPRYDCRQEALTGLGILHAENDPKTTRLWCLWLRVLAALRPWLDNGQIGGCQAAWGEAGRPTSIEYVAIS